MHCSVMKRNYDAMASEHMPTADRAIPASALALQVVCPNPNRVHFMTSPDEPQVRSTARVFDGARNVRGSCRQDQRFVLASLGRHALAIVAAASLAAGFHMNFGDPAFSNFSCTSPEMPGGKKATTLPVRKGSHKGLCLDLTTWNMCPDKIPAVWPLTHEPVKALRLFQPESWQDQAAWQNLKSFLGHTASKVLVGTPISCNQTQDRISWQKTLSLLGFLGRDLVMGLAVGNEIELLPDKGWASEECYQTLLQRAEEHWRHCIRDLNVQFDGEFADLPMTTVMTGGVVVPEDGQPWIPQKMTITNKHPTKKGDLDIQGFYRKLFSVIARDRFVFTFNIYSYFLPCATYQPAPPCDEVRRKAVCFNDASCFTLRWASGARYALRKFAQNLAGDAAGDAAAPLRLWIGEVGWSSPQAASLSDSNCKIWGTQMCDHWSDLDMLSQYYSGFMNWDLSLGGDLEPVEYAFYFTIRDSFNFNVAEHFGLCGSAPQSEDELSSACENRTSKLMPPAVET